METFLLCALLAVTPHSTPTCWKVVTSTKCAQEIHAEWEKDYAWVQRNRGRKELTFLLTCAPYGQFQPWERLALPSESHRSE